MSPSKPATGQPEPIDTDTVRRLCGAGVFEEANRLERDGHVLSPTHVAGGLEAGVRGTWRRVDKVHVAFKGGRLQPECTRDGAEFCRHVGALLLHYARKPSSFTTHDTDEDDVEWQHPDPRWNTAAGDTEAPAEELSRLLDEDTANHLRVIARRRDIRLSGTKKADLVQQMAEGLLRQDDIDAALAGLDATERTAIDAIHLMTPTSPATGAVARASFETLGGSGEMPIEALMDRGLVFDARRQSYGGEGYVVPRTVAARLPAAHMLAAPVASAADSFVASDSIGVIEMIQIIAQATVAASIKRRPRTKRNEYVSDPPSGLHYDPAETGGRPVVATVSNADGIRLVTERLLTDGALKRLSGDIGQPEETIEFALRIMYALQIAGTANREVTIRFDLLPALLDQDAASRTQLLARAWLSASWPSIFEGLFGPNGTLEARWKPGYSYPPQIKPGVGSAARLVTRLISRMPTDTPFSLSSFEATVVRMIQHGAAPLVQLRDSMRADRALSLTPRAGRGAQSPLSIGTADGWGQFISALVTAILSGPLTWLGFVEMSQADGTQSAFRVLPDAGVLRDRTDVTTTDSDSASIRVDDDLTVLVHRATVDVSINGFLSRSGHMLGVSAEGIRYRLTPAGVQSIFDSGMSGPELTAFLAERAGGKLPQAAEARLQQLWEHYGTIRLYDEVTILELGDDFLLTELTAATPLGAAIVQVFSPRLIAIDSDRVDDIVVALTERGYAPRVIEAG